MSDLEFDVLDELYFVTDFSALHQKSGLKESELIKGLQDLVQKGWVNYFTEVDGAANPSLKNPETDWKQCFFLATKKGLMAHNTL